MEDIITKNIESAIEENKANRDKAIEEKETDGRKILIKEYLKGIREYCNNIEKLVNNSETAIRLDISKGD